MAKQQADVEKIYFLHSILLACTSFYELKPSSYYFSHLTFYRVKTGAKANTFHGTIRARAETICIYINIKVYYTLPLPF